MLGFVIGTACLIGLLTTLRRGGRGGCGGYGYGRFGGHEGPWGHHHGGRRGRGGWGGGFGFRGGRRHMLAFLFERLDTTASQEKVIAAALDELREAMSGHHGELRRTRADVAAATRSPSFDETRLGELFARHDDVMTEMRKSFVGALGKIHAVLDDRQRERLADLIEGEGFYRGFARGGEGRPWGGAWA